MTCDNNNKSSLIQTNQVSLLKPVTASNSNHQSEKYLQNNKFLYVIGLPNSDAVSCYANATLQSLLHCNNVREKFLRNPECNPLNSAMNAYISRSNVKILDLRAFSDNQFRAPVQQDVSEFITNLCIKSNNLNSALQYKLFISRRCSLCNDYRMENPVLNYILILALPYIGKKICTLQEVIDYNIGM